MEMVSGNSIYLTAREPPLIRGSLLTVAGEHMTLDWIVGTHSTRVSPWKKSIKGDEERADLSVGQLLATHDIEELIAVTSGAW